MKKYSFWTSFIKTLVRLGIMLLPVAMTFLPQEWMNITLGGVLMMVFDKLKAQYNVLA